MDSTMLKMRPFVFPILNNWDKSPSSTTMDFISKLIMKRNRWGQFATGPAQKRGCWRFDWRLAWVAPGWRSI